jgi:enoyl-CoA hydratase/carnithine racemase
VARLTPVAEAGELLDGLRSGWGSDQLGGPAGAPLLVVDLDAPQRDVDLRPPAGLLCVLVGVSAAAVPPRFPDGLDVLLSAAVDPGPPWVAPPGGVEAGLDALERAVLAHPIAAGALVEVLRTSETLGRDAALVVESFAYSTLQGGPEHEAWRDDSARRVVDERRDPAVALERRAAQLIVTLDRPERRNAYSTRMRDDLVAALELAAADPTIEEVVLRGRGANFSSGGDLAEFGSRSDPASAHAVRIARSAAWWLVRLDQLGRRVVAEVHGGCVGAGTELAAFARRVRAAPDATFRLPEVAMGLIPGAGGTVSIPRRIGRERAAWMAVTSAVVDAPTALSWGLVDVIDIDIDQRDTVRPDPSGDEPRRR